MMYRKKTLIALASALLLAGGTLVPTIATAGEYQPSITRFAEKFAIPTYEDLTAKAAEMEAASEALCAAPDEDRYRAATSHFAALVQAWSRAEVIRMGPVKDQNRFEKLYFWPDPRSRGLKQVQQILSADTKEAQETMNGLSHASVAIQGLPALEYLLLSAEEDKKTAFATGSTRCVMATGIATNIHTLSREILEEWGGANGFAKQLEAAGPNNPRFHSEKEVIQDIIRMPVELLQIVEESKINSSLGKSAEHPKGKRAPFWRSDLVLQNFRGNVEAIRDLMTTLNLDEYMPEGESGLDNSLQFEMRQVVGVFERLTEKKLSWLYLLQDAEGYEQLQYVQYPLQGVRDILADQYPAVLDLQLGFNSLDGD